MTTAHKLSVVHPLVCISFPVPGWHVSGRPSSGINSFSGFRLARNFFGLRGYLESCRTGQWLDTHMVFLELHDANGSALRSSMDFDASRQLHHVRLGLRVPIPFLSREESNILSVWCSKCEMRQVRSHESIYFTSSR